MTISRSHRRYGTAAAFAALIRKAASSGKRSLRATRLFAAAVTLAT